MEAEELMIGDWVSWAGEHNLKVRGTAEEECWFGLDAVCDLIPNEELLPIPLTPEILEKNGFERRGGISYHKSIAGLIIAHWNDELCFLNYSKKNIPSIMIPFHYVHELQHALRLCGLTELVDNFKV